MKKLIRFTIVLAAMLLASQAVKAEGVIVKGGYTSTQLSIDDVYNIKGMPSWHAGLGYQTTSKYGFTLQPELLYVAKNFSLDGTTVTTHNLQIPVNLQWGIDLLVAKPFIFVSPYLMYNVKNLYDGENDSQAALDKFLEGIKTFDYGVGIGAGINIFSLQLTVKYSWALNDTYNWSAWSSDISNLDTSNAMLDISLGINF